ncbi:MAG: T9SS type A sorting domain-containing protein [Bacteroidales bacterium]
MLSLIHYLLLLALVLFSAFRAAAQLPIPDKVCVGASKSYWVDSTANPGSTYTWAIDGTVVQSGTTCVFAHTWNFEGTFELTLKQVSAKGCSSEASITISVYPSVSDPGFGIKIFPNPLYGPDVKFQLALPVSSRVIIELFEPNGQLISRIFDGYLSGGESKTIIYNGHLPQGVYPYQIMTDNQVINGRIIIIRVY